MDNEKRIPDVPYIVHESMLAREERNIKRLVVALVISILLLFACNVAWLYVWCQYDYVGEEITVDSGSGGNANYIGNNGDINNGKD